LLRTTSHRVAVIESERCDRRPIMIRTLILPRNNRTARPMPLTRSSASNRDYHMIGHLPPPHNHRPPKLYRVLSVFRDIELVTKVRVIHTARIVCVAGSMKLTSVRLSVCPSHHSPAARRSAGLLLSAVPAGDIDRQRRPPGAAARHTAANCSQ